MLPCSEWRENEDLLSVEQKELRSVNLQLGCGSEAKEDSGQHDVGFVFFVMMMSL